jgi:transaldolase
VKFFIDTADLKEVMEAQACGILDGVTTNPSLVAKTGRDYLSVIKDICEVCRGPVSAEVLSVDYEGMMREAREWVKLASNIVVKIPLTEAGIKAVVTCTAEGIKTNVTLVAKAGATYVSPFVGRLDDIGQNGMDVIRDIRQIFSNYNFRTEILVASIRHPIHLFEAAKAGANVSTIPLSVFKQLVKHPLTDTGLAKFIEDSKKIPGA